MKTTTLLGLAMLVTLPAVARYQDEVLADNPVAYWRLNEGSGNLQLTDSAGTINGTYVTTVTMQQPGALVGDTDTSGSFDGYQSKAEVSFNTNLNQAAFTVELWAKVAGNDGAFRGAVASRADVPQRGYIIYAGDNNRWQFWTGTGSGWDVMAGTPIVNDQWTHLAATYDGTIKRFYVNGVEVASRTVAFEPNPLHLLRIGASLNDSEVGQFFFYGGLDEIAYYGHALTPERVLAHFSAGVADSRSPEVLRQPVSKVAFEGDTVELSVLATGSLPLGYQWQFKGSNLQDQTNANLVLQDLKAANAGDYQVIVSNAAGQLPSAQAKLTLVLDIPYSQAVLQDSPVGYWRLGEPTGQITAIDQKGIYSAPYLNGVTLGRPGALPRDQDTAAGFQVTPKTKIDVSFSEALNPTAFTVECWAKATGRDGAYRAALTSRTINPNHGYILYAGNNNRWQFWTGLGTSGGSGWNNMQGPNVVNGQWVHLVGTYDGTTKVFYVNGTRIGAIDLVFVPNASAPLRIGGGNSEDAVGNLFFEGDIDEVAVYNSVLSDERVQIHYALGARPAPQPPTLQIQRTSQGLVVTWDRGTLEQADGLGSGWSIVTGAQSPLNIESPAGQKFFRVRE